MRPNPVRLRLDAGQPSYGIWLSLPSVDSARLLARLGSDRLDWLAIDAEHAPLDPETMARMVSAVIEARGPAPLVRIAHASEEHIKRALDAGALGVIAPMVNTRAQAELVVAAAKYPPLGSRSFGSPWAGLGLDLGMHEYRHAANTQTLAVVQIETAEALSNLEDICSVPGLDAIFVGPVDLALSLGCDPRPEPRHPRFAEAMSELLRVAKAHELPAGIFCSSPSAALTRAAQGFTLMNATTDLTALLEATTTHLSHLPSLP